MGDDPLHAAIVEVGEMCPGSRMAQDLHDMYFSGDLSWGTVPSGYDGVTTWNTWQGQYSGGDYITIGGWMAFDPGLPGLLRHEYGHVGGLPHDANGDTWADNSCGPPA